MTNYSQIISAIYEISKRAHEQYYHAVSERFSYLMDELKTSEAFMRDATDTNSGLPDLLSNLMDALEHKDMILLSDLLEEGLLPIVQKYVVYEEPFTELGYSVEPSSSGLWTLKDLTHGHYLHTNINPLAEAEEMIETSIDLSKETYAVWGLGLGYHVKALAQKTLGAASIKVFEEEDAMISLFEKYGCSDLVSKDCVEIVHDADGTLFYEFIAEQKPGILMHYPSVKKVKNDELAAHLKDTFLAWNSTVLQKDLLRINFLKNNTKNAKTVDTLKNRFQGKDVLYAGGGPSLITSLEFIKKNRENLIILTATTVLKKLLDAGVTPDYAVVLDPQERTYGHMKDVENCAVPLIFASTAFWKFAAYAKGECYIAYQKMYEPAEEMAKEKDCMTFSTGGSVTTIALDIAISLGAKRVYFAGVDMGFPGGKTHAEGTMDESSLSEDGLISIKSVKGENIYTDEKLYSYLRWIEKEIQKNPQTEYINLSDCGALIHGMKPLEH